MTVTSEPGQRVCTMCVSSGFCWPWTVSSRPVPGRGVRGLSGGVGGWRRAADGSLAVLLDTRNEAGGHWAERQLALGSLLPLPAAALDALGDED